MGKDEERKAFQRATGSIPWLKSKDVQRFRTRTFKSGNSLALRLPVGVRLAPGMEIDLRVEDGVYGSFEPVDEPKRKFNIDKVWGSASDLTPIDPEKRSLDTRPLDGDE
jgi:antitoxin VapB